MLGPARHDGVRRDDRLGGDRGRRGHGCAGGPGDRRPGCRGNGTVWVLADGGEPEERAVTLGLTDGEQIEVREGLTEGESVLQFVPVADDEIVEGGDGYAMYGPGG